MAPSALKSRYQHLPTISAKIRAMAADGVPRSEIARHLGKRYQHVRKVLVDEEARRAKAEARQPDVSRPQQPSTTRLKLGADGRIVIPANFREALGLKEGDVLIASVEDGELHLLTIPAAVRRAQAMVRKFVPEGVSLVDELIADRRREAEEEARDG
jgi:AbrB family looped-hinge helix DNA binding protein